jgi:hypothetical protein
MNASSNIYVHCCLFLNHPVLYHSLHVFTGMQTLKVFWWQATNRQLWPYWFVGNAAVCLHFRWPCTWFIVVSCVKPHGVDVCFRWGVCCVTVLWGKKLLPWRWRHRVTPKHWYFCAQVHGFTSPNNVIMMTILPCCSMDLLLITYLLTPCSRLFPEKLTVPQPVKKFPVFYGTRRFITAFTSARHLSLSWGSSIQSIPPHATSWVSVLILSSHLRLGLPSGLFPSGFPTQPQYMPLLSPLRATCPAHT